MEAGSPVVVVNEEGARTTPSIVAFDDNKTLVGVSAKRQAVVNAKNTVYSAKRFIGSRFNEVKSNVKKVPYTVKKSKSGYVEFSVDDKTYAPQEISAKVLQKLKQSAENYLGEDVTEAVITVPAYFNDSQRQATKDAGKVAGLDVKRIINEPTAAALAYGLDKKSEELIVVYDFGGGTFDISILEVGEGVIEVLSTSGDTQLGGDNIDEKLIDYFIEGFKKESGIDVTDDPMVVQRLREAAEKSKIELSSTVETDINLPFLTADSSGPKHFNMKITRSKFNQLIGPIVKKTFDACKTALKDADKKPGDINSVVLVGGSTRIPLVLEHVESFFAQSPHRGVNPDEVVAMGAAVQGGVLAGDVKDVLLLDVTPLSLGIETMGGVFTKLITKNTTIPAKKTEIFSTAANNQPSVEIHVLQGERDMASHNRTLGRFNLDGIPPAPRGVPQVEVVFDIDANGILKVSAIDKATEKDQSITITNTGGLSDEEIQQMIQDAEKHADEDAQAKKMVETKNSLSTMIYQVESSLEQLKGVGTFDSDKVMPIITEAKEALETDDIQLLDTALKSLETVVHDVTKAMYEQVASQQPDPNATDTSTVDVDIVDEEAA
jgi:molecular chaperone DnaK